jgi:hypothetical protein
MRSAEARFVYDEAFARLATRRFLSRYARGLIFLIVALAIGGVLFIAQRSYVPGVAALVLSLSGVFGLLRYRRRAPALARKLGCPEIHIVADDGGMSFRMNGSQSRAEWTKHRTVWRFDDVWLFFPYSVSASYTGIPTAAMSAEFQAIIVDNVQQHGGTLR